MAAAALMLMYTNPPPGREAEFARWYDEIHIPDVCSIPGIASGTRYELAGPGAQQVARDGSMAAATFLTVYELDHGDEAAVRAAIASRVPELRAAGRMFDGDQQLFSTTIYRLPAEAASRP